MTPRHALETAQDKIRVIRNEARESGTRGGPAALANRHRQRGLDEAIAVMTMMLAKIPETPCRIAATAPGTSSRKRATP